MLAHATSRGDLLVMLHRSVVVWRYWEDVIAFRGVYYAVLHFVEDFFVAVVFSHSRDAFVVHVVRRDYRCV